MTIIRLACKDHKKKTHRIMMEGSLLGRYGMWLCDDCYNELENPYLLIDYDELEQDWADRDFRLFIDHGT